MLYIFDKHVCGPMSVYDFCPVRLQTCFDSVCCELPSDTRMETLPSMGDDHGPVHGTRDLTVYKWRSKNNTISVYDINKNYAGIYYAVTFLGALSFIFSNRSFSINVIAIFAS